MIDVTTTPGAGPGRRRFRGAARPRLVRQDPAARLADGLAITGLLTSISNKAWGYAALLAVTLVLSTPLPAAALRADEAPAATASSPCSAYPVLYNLVASTTNYGTGHAQP